ncbi:unnamed protein product, partial [Prorocentrum cordatum]
ASAARGGLGRWHTAHSSGAGRRRWAPPGRRAKRSPSPQHGREVEDLRPRHPGRPRRPGARGHLRLRVAEQHREGHRLGQGGRHQRRRPRPPDRPDLPAGQAGGGVGGPHGQRRRARGTGLGRQPRRRGDAPKQPVQAARDRGQTVALERDVRVEVLEGGVREARPLHQEEPVPGSESQEAAHVLQLELSSLVPMPFPSNSKPLLLFHVPKCAGSTLEKHFFQVALSIGVSFVKPCPYTGR